MPKETKTESNDIVSPQDKNADNIVTIALIISVVGIIFSLAQIKWLFFIVILMLIASLI